MIDRKTMDPNTRMPSPELATGRTCLRAAIPEIEVAKGYLDEAVSAHLAGQFERAKFLICLANSGVIRDALREWTESLWGKNSPYNQHRNVERAPPHSKPEPFRALTAEEKRRLHERDGYHCRFCGIPVIRKEIRDALRKFYGDTVIPFSAKSNKDQHAAFQAMWAQYDHILPRARGGRNDLSNMVVTCAPCNFGRGGYTLEEVGLIDPRTREPIQSTWDGLDRLLRASGKRSEGCLLRDDWIFPRAEGISIDPKNGCWSDGAFFDEDDIPVEWHRAEPALHVQDRQVWHRWLEHLETSSEAAARDLLIIAKSRARAKLV